jgi:hypothetical protein
MQSPRTKQVRAERLGTTPRERPTVVAYDPYFPPLPADDGTVPDVRPVVGRSLVFNPYFPKLERIAVEG